MNAQGTDESERSATVDERRSGQVRFVTRPKSRTMRTKRKINVLELTERGAEMSNELENDRAMGG
jgi:hypothetical protein